MKQHGSWHEVISSAQSNTFISAKNAHWTCLYWRITHLHRSSARTILEQQHSVATVFRQLHRGEWCKGFVWRLLAPKFCTCCLFSWKSSWIKLPPIMAFCATKSGQLPGQICTNTLVNSPLKTHKRFFPLHKFPQVSTYWIFLAIFWSKLTQGCVGLLQTVQTHQADSKGRKFETFWHNPKFNNTWAMIKNPCDIPLHKLICKDFGPHSGFGHCSLNNKSIHWFNQPPNWKYSEPSFVKSCSRRTDGTTVRHTNHPHKTKQPTQKPPPSVAFGSRCLPKEAPPKVAAPYVALTQRGRLPPCRELFALAPPMIFSCLHAPFLCAAYGPGVNYVAGCCGPPAHFWWLLGPLTT